MSCLSELEVSLQASRFVSNGRIAGVKINSQLPFQQSEVTTEAMRKCPVHKPVCAVLEDMNKFFNEHRALANQEEGYVGRLLFELISNNLTQGATTLEDHGELVRLVAQVLQFCISNAKVCESFCCELKAAMLELEEYRDRIGKWNCNCCFQGMLAVIKNQIIAIVEGKADEQVTYKKTKTQNSESLGTFKTECRVDDESLIKNERGFSRCQSCGVDVPFCKHRVMCRGCQKSAVDSFLDSKAGEMSEILQNALKAPKSKDVGLKLPALSEEDQMSAAEGVAALGEARKYLEKNLKDDAAFEDSDRFHSLIYNELLPSLERLLRMQPRNMKEALCQRLFIPIHQFLTTYRKLFNPFMEVIALALGCLAFAACEVGMLILGGIIAFAAAPVVIAAFIGVVAAFMSRMLASLQVEFVFKYLIGKDRLESFGQALKMRLRVLACRLGWLLNLVGIAAVIVIAGMTGLATAAAASLGFIGLLSVPVIIIASVVSCVVYVSQPRAPDVNILLTVRDGGEDEEL
eukprot:TRINITY_DN921_c0_g1_i1.p1 TRINITY_DN921_c0_g1~~TRINITY_DN921_c0_g1_i1.p1  ORF type:complete len:518 (+),score=139.11 TRINITY_DN921_c0_g1_i1:13-1566(+)